MLLLAAAIGLGVYVSGRLGWLGHLEAHTMDQISIKLLLPLMFFFAFTANTHLPDKVGWEVAYFYIAIVWAFFWICIITLSFIPVLKGDKDVHAFNMSSNHTMLIAAPLGGLLLGLDAMPVIVLGMLGQLGLIVVSAFV